MESHTIGILGDYGHLHKEIYTFVMKIVTIKEDSPHLQNVLELWRRNRETLGFLPTEAFVKGAREETLLVSESPSGDFQGYLLFRKSLTKATIVHLCVQENYRLLGR